MHKHYQKLLTGHYILSILFCWALSSTLKGQSYEVVNAGLYGGPAIDLTFSHVSNRIFAASESPASAFYSDDFGENWYKAFPYDSLEYGTNQGWGGGAVRVYSNKNGWVGYITKQQGGTLTAAVFSPSNGNTGTFLALVDNERIKRIYPTITASVSCGWMTDYFFYVAMDSILMRFDGPHIATSADVVLTTGTIPGTLSDRSIRAVAAANSYTGYPVYMVINTGLQQIVKYDGTSFSWLSPIILAPNYEVEDIFTHPGQPMGDTIFASIKISSSGERRVYRSLDGGSTWTNITPTYGTNWPLHSADFYEAWEPLMPSSNGLRISFPGGGVSDDLGDTWTSHILPDNSMASYPGNPDVVMGAYGLGIAKSTTGAEGPFNLTTNNNYECVKIRQLARVDSVFYAATKAGLAFTTDYYSSITPAYLKWVPPLGLYPVCVAGSPGNALGGDLGVTSVAINPNNTFHVVAGMSIGFAYSFSGHLGFQYASAPGWNSLTNYDAQVNDILFVNDSILLAVTGAGSNILQYPSSPYGNIWRSTDGGRNWTTVTPSGFLQGNSLDIGVAGGDTVIYAVCGYWDPNFPKVDGQIWKSTDKGLTWTYVGPGPTGVASGTSNMPIYDISIDPTDNNTIYLASGQNLDYCLAYTHDAFATTSSLPIIPHGAFSNVLVKSAEPHIVYCGARRNVFRYNTITNTLSVTFNGLPGEMIPDLEEGSLLVGTYSGIFHVSASNGSITTIWNGTGNWSETNKWSEGKPSHTSNVVINSGTVTLDESAEVYKMDVQPGATVIVPESNYISISDTLKLHADQFLLSSFINLNPTQLPIIASIESSIDTGRWYFVSAPVTDALSQTYYSAQGSTWLKFFSEPDSTWNYITDLNQPLIPGKGYALWYESQSPTRLIYYRGSLNNSNLVVPLIQSTSNNGWNLIGNPFPSGLSWSSGAWERSHTTQIAYIWNNGSYLSSNTLGIGSLPDGIIPPGQAFFVQATQASTSITIPLDAQVPYNQHILKNSPQALHLNIQVSNGIKREITTIAFMDQATTDIDPGWDAIRLKGDEDAPAIYTVCKGRELCINTQPMFTDSVSIPLFITAHKPQSLFISMNVGELLSHGYKVFLVDLTTGKRIPFSENTLYTYYYSGKTLETPAFDLVIKRGNLALPKTATSPVIPAYVLNHRLIVDVPHCIEQPLYMEVVDLAGRTLLKHILQSGRQQIILPEHLPVFILKMYNEKVFESYKIINL